MIKLPENWRDTIRVLRDTYLMIALVNANREYFLFMKPIDKAFTLDDQLDFMERESVAVRIQRVLPDGTSEWLPSASNEDWLPMPIPDTAAMSLAQYRAHHQLAEREDARAAQSEGQQ